MKLMKGYLQQLKCNCDFMLTSGSHARSGARTKPSVTDHALLLLIAITYLSFPNHLSEESCLWVVCCNVVVPEVSFSGRDCLQPDKFQ